MYIHMMAVVIRTTAIIIFIIATFIIRPFPMLVALATLVPSLVCNGPVMRASLVQPRAGAPPTALQYGGDLPSMYRKRWAAEPIAKPTSSKPLAKEQEFGWASASGAVLGVSTACLTSVKLSSALTDFATAQPDYGDATAKYTGAMDAMYAAGLPTPGELVFAVAVSVDVAALFSFFLLAVMMIANNGSSARTEAPGEEACILSADQVEVCGELSFDSTDGYACVENAGVWVCA